MGLDAVVYIHRNNLSIDENYDAIETDEDTGEVYFVDEGLSKPPPVDTFTAIQKSLGNVAMIGALLQEVLPTVGHTSLLRDKVLYSGSHSGDVINLEQINALEMEIELVKDKARDKHLPELQNFLEDMRQLIEVAKEQKNPIVFV